MSAPRTSDVLVINPNLHRVANCKARADFTAKLENVAALRTMSYPSTLDLYPASSREWNRTEGLHYIVSNGDFSKFEGPFYSDYKYFGVVLPEPTYLWVKNTTIGLLQRQIICWLASLYVSDPSKQHIMQEQIYPLVFKELKTVAEQAFPSDLAAWRKKLRYSEYDERAQAAYLAACGTVYGSQPPTLLSGFASLNGPPAAVGSPAEYLAINDPVETAWRVQSSTFSLAADFFYMSERDWKSVIEQGSDDSLIRAESSEENWEKWRYVFDRYDSRNSHVYEFYADIPTRGFVYVLKDGTSLLHKIGWTANADISRRVAQLQTGNPGKITIATSFPVGHRGAEAILHQTFASVRRSGEWFSLSDDDVRNIESAEWRRARGVF